MIPRGPRRVGGRTYPKGHNRTPNLTTPGQSSVGGFAQLFRNCRLEKAELLRLGRPQTGVGLFVGKEPLLPPQAAPIPPEVTPLSDYPMTWDHDGDAILPVGVTHRSPSALELDAPAQILVGPGLTVRNAS